jgi:hypothetical protein
VPSPHTETKKEVELSPVDTEVNVAVREILALRTLTKNTGNHTTYAQNIILRKLSPVALTRVAVILAEKEVGA